MTELAVTDTALAGRRVLDLTGPQGAYCGKLLADLGADLIKIEPPEGDASRQWLPRSEAVGVAGESLYFHYMNTGKKSLTLDLNSETDRAIFRQLVKEADLVVEALPVGQMAQWGLSCADLHNLNPALVMTSISGFGQSGPFAHFQTSNAVASAMGGAMMVTGMPDDPPVTLAGHQAYVMGSTLAAVSSLIALHHAGATGQGQHVDISLQETMLAVTSICGVGKWLDDGIVPKRFGTGLFAAVPSGTYPCKDGSVYLIVNRPRHWQVLAEWVREKTGIEEIGEPMFEGPSSMRQPYRELLDIYIRELTLQYGVEAFYREAQQRHLAVTPLNNAHGVLNDPHLVARGFFQLIEGTDSSLRYPGAPYRLSATPWRMQTAAPLSGQHNQELDVLLKHSRSVTKPMTQIKQESALAGLRVIEFGAGMAGPWIGRIMAYCGAEVIRVESRQFPDVTRLYVPPRAPELGVQSQLSPWLTDWNAGKRYVSLDLSKADAIELVTQLIATADIVVDNNANGVLRKLGIDFDALHTAHPELILFSSTGYGCSGPDAHYISWGPNIETLSGLANLSGFPHRDCTMTQFAYPDPLSALHGLVAIMAALDYRRRSGRGQIIRLSQLEAVIAAMGDVMMEVLVNDREPEKLGNRSLHCAPQGCYPCRGDDVWCVISVADEPQWQALVRVFKRPQWLLDQRFSSWQARQRHWQELDHEIATLTRHREAFELMHCLQQAGIAAGVVETVEDQLERDEHLKQRGFFEQISHVVKGQVTAPGLPLGLTLTPGKTPHAGKPRGADNEAVFCELLHLSRERYMALCQQGVIEQADFARHVE